MGDDDEEFAALVARVAAARGQVCVIDLPGQRTPSFVDELDIALDRYADTYSDVEIRTVLGGACRTKAGAVDQFVTALQLPYPARHGWHDLLLALGDLGVSRRQCVLVVEASQLLADADRQAFTELVEQVAGGPYCFGGGWTTLVLADDEAAWRRSGFRPEAGAGAGRG